MNLDCKHRLIETATRHFATFGFEGTSLRKLAEDAGANVALVSYYFGSKEQLFEHIAITHLQHVEGNVDELLATFPLAEDFLDALIDFQCQEFFSHSDIHRMVLRELGMPQRSSLSASLTDQIGAIQQKILSRLSHSGRAPTDVHLSMITIVGTLFHLINASPVAMLLFQHSPVNAPLFSEELRDTVANYLKTMLKPYLFHPQADSNS